MELKKLLGKRIHELRHKNNMKQSELAEAVGIATKSQSCIETGKNYPSSELVERYAKVFNLDIPELLALSHIKSTKELRQEIIDMIKSANDDEVITIHKIIKGLLH